MAWNNNLFKRLKLVDEDQVHRIVEKSIRDYNPELKAMGDRKIEISDILSREDLCPEEKITLLKANKQQYSNYQSKARFGPNSKIFLMPKDSSTIHPSPPPTTHRAIPIASSADHAMIAHSQAAPETPHDEAHITSPVVQEPVPHADVTGTFEEASDQLPETISTATPGNEKKSTTDEKTCSSSTTTNPSSSTSLPSTPIPMPRVQNIHKDKISFLTQLISLSTNAIARDNNTGEIIIDGSRIQNSSFHDLIQDLYVADDASNLTGKSLLISTISRLLRPGGKWAGVATRNIIPRTSILNKIKENNRDFKESEQRGSGFKRCHPSKPPGRKVKTLHLY